MFQKEVRGELKWKLLSVGKNSALTMVTIKPPSTGEARKVSVEKVVPVSFYHFLDIQIVRSRIANQIDHNSITPYQNSVI